MRVFEHLNEKEPKRAAFPYLEWERRASSNSAIPNILISDELIFAS
jgi:hypothetical protein